MSSIRNRPPFALESFVVGPMAVNCYLLADPRTRKACLIDPGAEPRRLLAAVREAGYDLAFIVNTHGHGDHIAGNGACARPVYIHRLDAAFLTDPSLNLSRHFIFDVKSPPAERLLEDKDLITLGDLTLSVIHTPGHTPGSISLTVGGIAFTGDTLFASGVGRTDFSYGDESALYRSIETRLFILPDDTVIYPGHGPSSTIAAEKGRL